MEKPLYKQKYFLAEFENQALETDFRKSILLEQNRRLFIIIAMVSAFFIAFLFLDLVLDISRANLYGIIAIRSFVALSGVVFCLLCYRNYENPILGGAAVLFGAILMLGFAGRTIIANLDKIGDPNIGVSGYLLILGIYIFSGLHFRHMLALGFFGSLTFICSAVVTQLPAATMINLMLWVVVVNLFGLFSANRLNRMRRTEFANVLTLRAANDRLASEVSERVQAENEARVAQREAEVANRAKTRFLASASHDLRQPLHALGLFTSTLKLRLTDKNNLILVDKLETSIRATNDLFGAILDISRLDADAINPKIRPVDIGRILDDLRIPLSESARAKGLDFRVMPCKLVAQTDPVMLHRIMSNFISNAIRYTESGKILVGARRYGDTIRLEVLDTGVGIPKDKIDTAFEEFEQLDNPNRRRNRMQGLGLGLAICRRLATLLGATISVTSKLGAGSRFTITLAPGSAMNAAATHIGSTRPEPMEQQTDFTELVGAEILVIDDERDILNGMAAILTRWKCIVHVATSVDEALETLNGASATLNTIIADYQLAGSDTGLDAVRDIRHALGREIPALIITGDAAREALSQAKREGLSVLHKPLSPEDLRAELAAILRTAPNPVG